MTKAPEKQVTILSYKGERVAAVPDVGDFRELGDYRVILHRDIFSYFPPEVEEYAFFIYHTRILKMEWKGKAVPPQTISEEQAENLAKLYEGNSEKHYSRVIITFVNENGFWFEFWDENKKTYNTGEAPRGPLTIHRHGHIPYTFQELEHFRKINRSLRRQKDVFVIPYSCVHKIEDHHLKHEYLLKERQWFDNFVWTAYQKKRGYDFFGTGTKSLFDELIVSTNKICNRVISLILRFI